MTERDPEIARLQGELDKEYLNSLAGDSATFEDTNRRLDEIVTDAKARPYGQPQTAQEDAAALGIDLERYLEG